MKQKVVYMLTLPLIGIVVGIILGRNAIGLFRADDAKKVDSLNRVAFASGAFERSYMQGNWPLSEFKPGHLRGKALKEYVEKRAPMVLTKADFNEPFAELPNFYYGVSTIDGANPLWLGLGTDNVRLGSVDIYVQTAETGVLYTVGVEWLAFETDPRGSR